MGSSQWGMLALLVKTAICRRDTVKAKGNDCGTKLKAEARSSLAQRVSWS